MLSLAIVLWLLAIVFLITLTNQNSTIHFVHRSFCAGVCLRSECPAFKSFFQYDEESACICVRLDWHIYLNDEITTTTTNVWRKKQQSNNTENPFGNKMPKICALKIKLSTNGWCKTLLHLNLHHFWSYLIHILVSLSIFLSNIGE